MHVYEPVDLRLVPEELRPRLRRWQDLCALLEEEGHEAEHEERIAGFVEEAGEDLALALALYTRASLEPAIATATAEVKAVRRSAKWYQAERDRIRATIGQILDRLGHVRLAGPTVRIVRTAGQERVEQHGAVDLDLLDDELVRKTTEPNLEVIGKRLRAGESIPGFRLVRTPGVMIR